MKVIISYYDINGNENSVLVDIATARELAVAVNTLANAGNFCLNVNMPKENQ